MARRLYIFVDESGNPSSGEYYTVAGCWCLSERPDIDAILSPTKNRLAATVEQQFTDAPVSELKGVDLPAGLINQLMSAVETHLYNDSTLVTSPVPWTDDVPIRYSFHNTNPDLGNEILARMFGSMAQAAEAQKALALVSVLNPLFYQRLIDRAQISEIQIVLDAAVWQQAVTRFEMSLQRVADFSELVSFSIRDSKATPGIQIADLAAYAWARYIRTGECAGASTILDRLRFAE
jgi:hypothetical protein